MAKHKFCTQCGASLKPGIRFCKSCGLPAAAESAETTGPTRPDEPPEPSDTPHETAASLKFEPTPSTPVPKPITEACAVAPAHPTVSAQIDKGKQRSILPKIFIGLLFVALLVISLGAGIWWFGYGGKIPGRSAGGNLADTGYNLIANGDFSIVNPEEFEGDGVPANLSGNATWQLTGPEDMAISLPLKLTPGKGTINIKVSLLIPTTTIMNEQLDGLRVRLRLVDFYESSAVADSILQTSETWQTVEHAFEDTDSGPYRLGIEVIGFTGPLYLDNVAAVMTDASMQSNDATANETTIMVNENSQEPAGSELETWVYKQAWFRQLEKSMPAGVSLKVEESEAEFPGWKGFEIREFHSPDSGFDPNVAPLVGLFHVSPDRSGVGWFDPVSAEWQPLVDFMVSRGLPSGNL